MKQLSIVVPIFNEEKNLSSLYQRCIAVVEKLEISYELIFVDDGSKDDSLALIVELANLNSNVQYHAFTRNFGHQYALLCGLENASGEAIVTIDADLQDPPEIIIELYQQWKQGFQLIYARRKSRKGETWIKKVSAFVFYRFLKRLVGFDIPLDTGDFRLMDKEVVKILLQLKEHQKYLRGQVAWIGMKSTYVEYDRDERLFGETAYPIKKQLKLAMDGITSFSSFPLKLVIWAGFIVSFLALLLIIYALSARLAGESTVPGWASIIISLLFLGGIQMISIGVLGQYIKRIDENVRNRPNYVVKSTNQERRASL